MLLVRYTEKRGIGNLEKRERPVLKIQESTLARELKSYEPVLTNIFIRIESGVKSRVGG